MFYEGCNYNLIRWKPSKNESFAFNSALQSFVVVSDTKGASNDNSKSNSGSNAGLLGLPLELLDDICSGLDAASLNSVSMSCKALRSVASSQLLTKGFIENTWIRTIRSDGKVHWAPGERRWRFGKVFSKSKNLHQKLVSEMGDHISRCPCYEPYIHPEQRVKVIFS